MKRNLKQVPASPVQVKLVTKKPAKTQVGDSNISPQVKLAAKKAARAQFGDSNISPQIKRVMAK